MVESPWITGAPRRAHKVWWTCLPVLPRDRSHWPYSMLRRQWFDHTMNTFRQDGSGGWRPNSRGFYTEAAEDHMTVVLFHIWAALPDGAWVPALLKAFGVQATGQVCTVRWAFSVEDGYAGPQIGRNFRIADIVLCWRDCAGDGVLVIETKKPGGALKSGDHPERTLYLRMNAIERVPRRHYGLLVDARDLSRARSTMGTPTPIITWAQLAALQIEAIGRAKLAAEIEARVRSFIAVMYGRNGVPLPGEQPLPADPAAGALERYREIEALNEPENVRDLLIAAEIAQAVEAGVMPQPPFPWLAAEPKAIDIYLAGRDKRPGSQTTQERRIQWWRLGRN